MVPNTYNVDVKFDFLRRRRWWKEFLVIAGLWTAYGFFNAYVVHVASPKRYPWDKAILGEVGYTCIAAILTPAFLSITRRIRRNHLSFEEVAQNGARRGPVPGSGSGARRTLYAFVKSVLLYIGVALLFSTVVKIPYDFALSSQEKNFWFAEGNFNFQEFLYYWNWGLNMAILPFGLVVVLDYAVDYYRRYQKGLVRSANLEAQLAQAQLQALKMQLDPHFLFNSLHAISALVHQDPDGAEVMIARLSDLLRLSLDNSRLQEVPLRQELEYLDLYLEIERTRFADRLTVLFDIDPETVQALVPNFILQPLVENAIRHGIGNIMSDGHVGIKAERQNGSVILRVTDNGPGLARSDSRERRDGVGLATTRARLERLYGSAQSLVLRNLEPGGFEARVMLPYHLVGSRNLRGENGRD